MEIYIEYALAENFLLDAMLLWLSLKAAKQKIIFWRIALASVLGAVFAVVFPLLDVGKAFAYILKFAVGILICLIAVNGKGIGRYALTALLFFGFSFALGGALLAAVGPAFRRESPQITLRIQELDTRSQQQAIAQGTLDLGFVALAQSQRTDDHYMPIRQDELLLALPAGHPACAFARPEEGQHPVLDLSLLRRAVFALPQPGSCLREYVDRLFQQAGYTPQILLESAGAASALALTAAGLCVSLVPGGLCCPPPEGVQLFCMPGHPQWALEAVTRKDAYLSKAARRFLQMAKEHFA